MARRSLALLLGSCVLVLGYSLKGPRCKDLSPGSQIRPDDTECTPDSAGPPSLPEGRALTPCHFTCSTPLEIINDQSSCSAFHVCFPDGPMGPFTCPGNTYFHWESQTCVEDIGVCCSVSCTPICTSVGVQIPDPTDCTKFYVCIEIGQPSEAVHLTCPSGKFFDAEAQRCLADAECEVVCATDVTTTSPAPCTPFCSTVGVQIADPNDCTRFYVCIEQGFPDESVHVSCRPTEHFDPETGRCVEGDECVSQCGDSSTLSTGALTTPTQAHSSTHITGPTGEITDTTSVSESTGTATTPSGGTTATGTPPSETTPTPSETTTPSEATTTPSESTTPSEATTTPSESTTPSEATTTPSESTTPSEATTTPSDTTTPSEATTTPSDTTTPSEATTTPSDTTTPSEATTTPSDTTTPSEATTTPSESTTPSEATTTPSESTTPSEATTTTPDTTTTVGITV
ncbi:mucin-22-like [Penaeus vannamei]|uniref:mucin-22-like n=1 Tax=Penaeus vannamei TaxID=6689 RepID=UPI00387F82E5